MKDREGRWIASHVNHLPEEVPEGLKQHETNYNPNNNKDNVKNVNDALDTLHEKKLKSRRISKSQFNLGNAHMPFDNYKNNSGKSD